MNLISVIIPAYNVEEYLARCLDSVLAQTHRELEILVINDGSTDGTAAIADAYAARDSRVKPIHQANAGLVAVRDRGIGLASGSYVSFIDGDDEIEPDMLERLLANAQKHDADISQCGILYCFYDGRRKPMHGTGALTVLDRAQGLRELLLGTRMEPSLCNKLYAAHILKDSCPDPTVLCNEDLLRNAVLFSRAKGSVFEDFCGYHYWRRAGSMSNAPAKAVRNAADILKARKKILELTADLAEAEALRCYAGALISGYNACAGIHGSDAAALRRRCRSELRELLPRLGAFGRGFLARAQAIVWLPMPYRIAVRLHGRAIQARIRRQAAQLRKEERP